MLIKKMINLTHFNAHDNAVNLLCIIGSSNEMIMIKKLFKKVLNILLRLYIIFY